jgi:hypothetical protein
MQHNFGTTYFPNYAAKPLRTYKEFGKKSRYAKDWSNAAGSPGKIQSLTGFRA